MDEISALNVNVDELLNYGENLQSAKARQKDEALQKVCNDFETVLTSTFLKQGMKSARELGEVEGEEKDSGTENFKDMAYEQLADFIGQQGMMGLGKVLYQSMKEKLHS